MIIRFWGTRGSIPVPGKNTLKYGGNTPCVEICCGEDYIILDAGSGIRELGNEIIRKNDSKRIHIFLSHYHWDHIQGILFFKPLYDRRFEIFIYGLSTREYSVESLLRSQMDPKNFPITIDNVSASLFYRNIYPYNSIRIGSLEVMTYMANHSSPTLIYKFINNGKAIVYMTDNELKFEHEENKVEYKSLVELCSNCDYLIHDTMYDEISEMKNRGWGHSSNISLANFAVEANVKNILLFHYNPDYDDAKVESLQKETVNYLEQKGTEIGCLAAKEGMEVEF